MKKPSTQSTLAILVATTVAGCSPFYVDWENLSVRRTPEQIQEVPKAPTTPSSENAPSRRQSASLRPRKHKQPTAPPDMEEMTIEPDATENSPAPTTSTISMASPGDSSGSAEKAVEATSQRLSHFDRNQLRGPMLATYDEANGFLNQGKQALAEKDYVAASGFAHKASVLADKLQSTAMAR